MPGFAIALNPLGIHGQSPLCEPPGNRLLRRRPERRLASPSTDQAMAATTVKTTMQVVNAKATAKIAAIFFMIGSPTFPS